MVFDGRHRLLHDGDLRDLVLIVEGLQLGDRPLGIPEVVAGRRERLSDSQEGLDPVGRGNARCWRYKGILGPETILELGPGIDRAVQREHDHHGKHDGNGHRKHHQTTATDGSLLEAAPVLLIHDVPPYASYTTDSRDC